MLDDFRFAMRRLGRSPGFSIIAILTLTLAIGVNVSVLSVADAVLFRPLPYDEPDRVFILRMVNRQTGQRYTRITGEHLQTINAHHAGTSAAGLLGSGPRILIERPDGAEPIATVAASPNYFHILGVRAARGRVFDERDTAATGRPALLVHSAWRNRFGADETLVGRSLSIGGVTLDVIGVLPPDFVFPSTFAGRPEVVTLMAPAAIRGGAFHPIVRLEAGVTQEQAQAEMDALMIPRTRRPGSAAETSVSLDGVRAVIYPVARSITLFLVASSVLVLLIGCANLANMLLARAARHERESGLRAALGAGRLQLVRPVILESLLIAAAGTLLALFAARAALGTLLPHIPRVAYGNAPIGLDLRVAAMALGMGLAAGLCFAIIPAWRAARVDPQELLRSRSRFESRGRGWLRHPLIAVQVAASIVLVFGAVATARAFVARLNVPLGFDPTDVVRVRVSPADQGTGLRDFYIRVIDTLTAQAGVVAAGAAGSLPLDASAPDEGIRRPDGSTAPAAIIHALPGYFQAARIPLLRGRLLDWDDVSNETGAALMSQSAAAAVFPGRDPLGETFENNRGRRFTVVGVVGDVLKSHENGMGHRDPPPAYTIPGSDLRALSLVVRMRPGMKGDAVITDLKRKIAPLAPRTPITAEWWADSISSLADYRNPRFQTIVLSGFGILALTLTAVGVFAVISFLVASRTREIGIRVAIGAEPRAVVIHMARQALAPAGVGLAAGVLATRWMARLVEAQLFKVDTTDLATLMGASIVVLVAAAVAAYVPARHAARVDPLVALRAE